MLWRVAVGPWRRSALLVSRAVAAGVAPPSPLSSAHVRRRPHHLRPTPTTVIPAEAGIQVGFHGNERAVRGVGGHVGHHRWTRGFGVLYRGTDLDPRLRGDDGRRGVQRSAKGGSDRGVACFGVWVVRRAGVAGSDDLIEQITPVGVGLLDQADFPRPSPAFQVFLAPDGVVDPVVMFGIDQPPGIVPADEALAPGVAMLACSPFF